MISRMQSLVLGDTQVEYWLDDTTGQVGLALLPVGLKDRVVPHRDGMLDQPEVATLPQRWASPPSWRIQNLVQLALVGEPPAGGFAQGRTMLDTPAALSLKYQSQQVVEEGDQTRITTTLASELGFSCAHELWGTAGQAALRSRTTFRNDASAPLILAMLSSFHLGRITPFAADDAPEQLQVHRFCSGWSAEGRLDTQTIEQLHLERSWIGHGSFSERFGQVGSMPVKGFFPLVAVEDTKVGVLWGAQLAWAGSWQLEIHRRDDFVNLSGGLADREFGHWTKRIAPGETFTTPTAHLACVHGTLDDLTDRLTQLQVPAADTQPQVEADLPIVFNEWCTSWGAPTHDQLVQIADRLKGSETRYLVIDAGWFHQPGRPLGNCHGDWLPGAELFPQGLGATAKAIRDRGLIPGLWFEMENVGTSSTAFSLTDHLLKRDGVPFTVEDRRFWDLNDPFVIDYLAERVTGLLERCGFGYLKVDYNETLGIGVDHSDSLGEGLRQQTEGTYRLFERIRRRMPELVIENCASGGHRLEPSMMALCSMGSFSDAHELKEIPIIAANLHRLILPRQSQVWAVLRPADDLKRLTYSLAATFLGRMCLSGEIHELADWQWERVLEAQRMYREIWPIIKHGRSRRFGPSLSSWRHPKGWQAMVRQAADGSGLLVVGHSFEETPGDAITLPLPPGAWRVSRSLTTSPVAPAVVGDGLTCRLDEPFSGLVVHLQREG